MKIGIFHGYELIGSGSNQATSYLARALARAGQEVHILCREPSPDAFDFIDKAVQWNSVGQHSVLFEKDGNAGGLCILHQLPLPPVNAVYITDTQRPGNVKAFSKLTDEELKIYHRFVVRSLQCVLKEHPVDILHTNHLVYQPVAAAEVCEELGIPFIIYPRGSSIEYTIHQDARYKALARRAILKADGLIIGNHEVRDRIVNLYPEDRDEILAKTEIVGLGVDTSLFVPVERGHRKESIEKIYEYAPFSGKPPRLSQELFSRLDTGEVEAVTAYRNAYQAKKPDADLVGKLQKIPWENKVLIFVGATIVGKGLQSLITALPFVLAKHPDTHLVIVGSGASRELFEALVYAIAEKKEVLLDMLVEKGYDFDPIESSGPWRDVQSFLSDEKNKAYLFTHGSNLLKHIHFLGRLNHDLLRYVFPCSDVGLFPSVVPEAYPNVILESLSNGVLPMVSYFSGMACGLDDLVPHLGQDLVDLMKIPVDDDTRIPRLIENLTGLLSDEALETMGPVLRKVAEEHYDWKIRAREMVEVYSTFSD